MGNSRKPETSEHETSSREKYPLPSFEEIEKRYPFDNMIRLLPFYKILIGPIGERLGLRSILHSFLAHPVPAHINYRTGFGTAAFMMFLIQIATGYLLVMFYQPTPDHAYESVIHITTTVPFGWLVRSLHFWSGNFMIIFVMMHLMRVFWHGAYKYPREYNWMVGVCLLILTLGFEFTGYLLPWNQVSYWATTVGTETATAVPVIGEHLLLLMRGGKQISAVTLTRFYAFHVFVLPAAVIILLAGHFFMMRRQGFAEPYSEDAHDAQHERNPREENAP